jgi:hypothetical protein
MATMLEVSSVSFDGSTISLPALRVGSDEIVTWAAEDAPFLLSDMVTFAEECGHTPREIVVMSRRLAREFAPASAVMVMKIKGGVVFVTE